MSERALRAVTALALTMGVGFPAPAALAADSENAFPQVSDIAGPGLQDADKPGDQAQGQQSGGASNADSAAVDSCAVESERKDLADIWESDEPKIAEAGSYVLTRDVHAEKPLEVSLEEGSSATVDLAGHSVYVSGGISGRYEGLSCALDLTGNEGQVAFVDSARKTSPAGEPPWASIRLVADSAARLSAVAIGSNWDDAPQPDDGSRLSNTPSDESDEEMQLALKGSAFSSVALELVRSQDDSDNPEDAAVLEDSKGKTFAVVWHDADGNVQIAYERPVNAGTQVSPAALPNSEEADGGGTLDVPAGISEDGLRDGEVGEGASEHAAEAADAEPLEGIEGKPDSEGSAAVLEEQPSASGAMEGPGASEAPDAGSAEATASMAQPSGQPVGGSLSESGAEDAGVPVVARVLSLTTQAAQDIALGTDLAAAWKTQANGLEATFTITQGGTYYLAQDLSTKSNLVVNAPGQDVVIRLMGHKLVIDGAGTAAHKTMVDLSAARSVTLDGAAASGTSAIESAGEMDVWAINCAAQDCSVSANDLVVRLSSKTNAQRSLSTHAIRMASGALTLARCVVQMDMGNQSLKSADLINGSQLEVPSAVYATADVDAVLLADCTVLGAGTQGFAVSDLSKVATIGNAYAVYSLARSTMVRGGSYKAVSLNGCATCLFGTALQLKPGTAGDAVKLEADAGQIAAGVMSTVPSGVLVDAQLQFGCGDDFSGAAQVLTALRGTVEGGFLLGGTMAQNAEATVSALVMAGSMLQAANADGACIGSFAGDVAANEREAVAGILRNALPKGACAPTAQGANAVFRLDSQNAVAQLDDGTLFSTVGEALAGFANGHTLTLLQDAGALEVSKTSAGVLDLGGHTIESLNFSTTTQGSGLTVANGTVSGTLFADNGMASVRHASPSPLTLSGVSIRAEGSDTRVSGVQATAHAGTLALRDGTQVTVKAARRSATASASCYGVYMATNGPALELDHAALSVVAASAGTAAYGAYSTKQATVLNSAVSVVGFTESTCGLYVGGTLDARSSVFNVRTQGSASLACGIWARTSNPKASIVALDSCSVVVGSAAPVAQDSVHACLLGASTHSGTVAPASYWRLSGQNTFRSAGGIHIGYNVGTIMMASDFSLGALSDAQLVVAQAKRDADKGIQFASDLTQGDAVRMAGLFSSAPGSYYDGWMLFPDSVGDASALVWRPVGSTAQSGVVEVEHAGAKATYDTMAAALASAQSGDRVALLADLAEAGTLDIAQDSLAIDLGGHVLTLRAGSDAKAGRTGAGAAVSYAGSGVLRVSDGTLELRVGALQEAAAGGVYQGISVSGGGSLLVASDAAIDVAYTGSTGASAPQRDVSVRGIALYRGSLQLSGSLDVVSAAADGGVGAMSAFGVFVEPGKGDSAVADISPEAQVTVRNATAANTIKNLYYPEATPTAAPQGGPYGLREITINPETDADFYNDVVKQFRLSASFDDPNDTTARNTFSASIYYADAMAVYPDDQDAWYYGLKIWAYSDEVKPADVGKWNSIVPTHFFVSSHYDELPTAYGVATGASAAGSAVLSVAGQVSATCPHGHSYAVDGQASASAEVSLTCSSATLKAQADSAVHPVAGKEFDLRDYIAFSSTQAEKVAYPGATISRVAKFANATARAIRIADTVGLTLDGTTFFEVMGGDAAAVEASSFSVGTAFALAKDGQLCTVANAQGENKAGAAFARSASGGPLVDASAFADAYAACTAQARGDATLRWEQADGYQVLFKLGDAVVARYAGPRAISLAQPTAAALRLADQRQEYQVVGWSTDTDEHATTGFEPADGAVNPTEATTYYAVYDTGLVDVPVTFSNVHDDRGALVDCPRLTARYGQTVGEALGAAQVELPQPADYFDEASGLTYTFVGWFPCSRASSAGPLLYDDGKLNDLAVTLSVNGVATGGMDLRAVYEAASADQHVVRFVVDGYVSSCVVADGERPAYTQANSANTNYRVPAKQATETGKTFTFKQWFVDANGNAAFDQGEQAYPSALPPASQNATYTADWTWKWSDVTYTFYTKRYDSATASVESNAPNTVDTTYEKKTQEVADSVMKVGGSIGAGGKVYTLRGWSTRKTDVDPMYDAATQLPSVSSSERAVNDTYSRTYYGVYAVSDHKVTVAFCDGTTELGRAQVVAASTSVGAAFGATGAATPADRSQEDVFLGWAASAGADQAVDATSTTIESLAPGTQETLSLYAVYGNRPAYTVRLRNADGSQLLYLVSVKRGATVAAALAQGGVTVDVASQDGKYFSGWRTASGTLFSLDSPVSGSVDCYASYADVKVATKDASDADASVTVSYAASAPVTPAEGLLGIEFSIAPRDSADTPLRSATASNGYTILKSYDMRLVATSAQAPAAQITGDFGTANIKVHVGTNYRNAKVRAFWLGLDGSSEAVKTSAVKDVDDQGYITLSIGNFTIGDEDEGGNLAIAYVEGGAGAGAPEGGAAAGLADDESGSGSAGAPGKAGGTKLASPTANLGGSAATLGSGALGSRLTGSAGSSLGSGLRSSLASGLGGSVGSGLGSSPASSLGSSGLSASAASAPTTAAGDSASAASVEKDESDEGDAQAGWDANAVVFVLIALALLALLGRRLWLLYAAKRRSDDDEDDFDAEAPADPYQNGIRF